MSVTSGSSHQSNLMLSLSPKVTAFESSFEQSLFIFKEIVSQFEHLYSDLESYKSQLSFQKEKCESKCCSGSEDLKKVILAKDNIIQLVASHLTKLDETKNFSLINEIFQLLCGESPTSKPTDVVEKIKEEINTQRNIDTLISPKKEIDKSEDVSFKDESMSEIEGTPTGRRSPIILPKNIRNNLTKSPGVKKKCPEDWSTPEYKAIKLSYTGKAAKSSANKLKQGRLNFTLEKQTTVVDLTNSPEIKARGVHNELFGDVQRLIKKESSENDDTILPSPTSGPNNVFKSKVNSKEKQEKFQRPPLSLKPKSEKSPEIKSQILGSKTVADDIGKMEESINILQPKRFTRKLKKESPSKFKTEKCNEASMSRLQNENYNENCIRNILSPSKRPLGENINLANVPTPPHCDADSSMSLLNNQVIGNVAELEDKVKSKVDKPSEPVYKEPTVRKKAEKQALPAWCCKECENFYGVLYKDDPEMIKKKIAECSKHRGKINPIRPNTPPNFWNPRWNVPADTEEFNRMNNAV